MVLKKSKETPEITWEIGSGLLPHSLRRVLDKKITSIHGADINGWTIVHMLIGGLFYLLNIGLLTANIAHAFWELFQAYFNITDLSMSSEWYDILFDTVAFNFGYLLFTWSFQ